MSLKWFLLVANSIEIRSYKLLRRMKYIDLFSLLDLTTYTTLSITCPEAVVCQTHEFVCVESPLLYDVQIHMYLPSIIRHVRFRILCSLSLYHM